jgi:hypothetical protein
MPSVSAKQEKFMRAVANSPKFAKKVGVPQSVGKEFEMKDKRMMAKGEHSVQTKSKRGAEMPVMKAKAGKAVKMKDGGKSYRSSCDGVATKGKTKAKQVKMAMGGKSC